MKTRAYCKSRVCGMLTIITAILLCFVKLFLIDNNNISGISTNNAIQQNTIINKSIKQFAITRNPVRNDGKCRLADVDPFNPDILKIMYNFGTLKCQNSFGLLIERKDDKYYVNAKHIDFIRGTEILHDDEKGYRFGEKEVYLKPIHGFSISRGKEGAIKNTLTGLCVRPEDYNKKKPPEEIVVKYSKLHCGFDETIFSFGKDGIIRHKATGKCLGPKGHTERPNKNTKLILSNNCKASFTGIKEGLLQHRGGACVHPLWGGEPAEGTKLCLYYECDQTQARLKFNWLQTLKDDSPVTSTHLQLKKEFNRVEIKFKDGSMTNAFLINVVPKSIPFQNEARHPNIFIFTIDQASSSHFKRKLPITYKYMKEVLHIVEFGMHAAISESVEENVMALLTGHFNGIDAQSSSLYGKTSQYATLNSADKSVTYNKDARRIAAIHESAPLFRALHKLVDLNANLYCVASQPMYDIPFNYLDAFLQAYKTTPKFASLRLTDLTYWNYNYLGYIDKTFQSTLEKLKSLPNTFIFIHTIKGSVIGKLGQLQQGLLEYKQPFLGVYASEDVVTEYRIEESRTSMLSTPYDMYATIRSMLSQPLTQEHFGKSLFKKINARTCKESGISRKMCPCV